MRTCNVCKEEKETDQYHKCKSYPLGIVYTCKTCTKNRSISWNKNNKDKKKAYGKEHYEKNKDAYLLRSKNSLWASNNKDRMKELQRKYYYNSNGAAKVSFYRNLRKKAIPPWLSLEQKEEIASFYWLAQDLERVSGYTYHVDHIVPIKGKNVCGLHVPWNLQVLPYDLNLTKSNRFNLDTKHGNE